MLLFVYTLSESGAFVRYANTMNGMVSTEKSIKKYNSDSKRSGLADFIGYNIMRP